MNYPRKTLAILVLSCNSTIMVFSSAEEWWSIGNQTHFELTI